MLIERINRTLVGKKTRTPRITGDGPDQLHFLQQVKDKFNGSGGVEPGAQPASDVHEATRARTASGDALKGKGQLQHRVWSGRSGSI